MEPYPWKDKFAVDYPIMPIYSASKQLLYVECILCRMYGRENNVGEPNPDGDIPADGESVTTPKRRKRNSNEILQWGLPYRTFKFVSHLESVHPKKYEQFLELKITNNREALKKFLDPYTKVSVYFEKENAKTIIVSDESCADNKCWILRNVLGFEGEISTVNDDDVCFETVRSMIAIGLSHNQIQESIPICGKYYGSVPLPVSIRTIANLNRFLAFRGVSLMMNIMARSISYSIAFDMGTSSSNSDHFLSIRIRMFCGKLFELNLLTIPMSLQTDTKNSSLCLALMSKTETEKLSSKRIIDN